MEVDDEFYFYGLYLPSQKQIHGKVRLYNSVLITLYTFSSLSRLITLNLVPYSRDSRPGLIEQALAPSGICKAVWALQRPNMYKLIANTFKPWQLKGFLPINKPTHSLSSPWMFYPIYAETCLKTQSCEIHWTRISRNTSWIFRKQHNTWLHPKKSEHLMATSKIMSTLLCVKSSAIQSQK